MTAQHNTRELVTVAGKAVEKLEYKGQAVVTFSMVDELHNNVNRDAGKRFARNRDKFEDGKDYLTIQSGQARSLGFNAPRGLTLLTESGYLKLVKTFTDELAWQVQGQLIECYFHVKQAISTPPAIPSQLELMKLALGAIEEATHTATQALTVANEATAAVQVQSDRVTALEESRRLENWQQANILKAVNHKVELWREMYPALNIRKAYPAIWRYIKDKFNVPRYNEIPAAKYDAAISIITKLNISSIVGM